MPITTRTDFKLNAARGLGAYVPFVCSGPAATTAANSTSGFTSVQILGNTIGSTLPATIQEIPMPTGLSSETLARYTLMSTGLAGNDFVLARLYKFGNVNLVGTPSYDGFTHDAATFPVLRTIHNQASQPIMLTPIICMLNATATSAPAFLLKTTAGGAGYVNQDGTNVVGTITFTAPSATTAAASCYFLPLERGDVGVRDITQISVTTASTGTCTADVWGMETLACCNSFDTGFSAVVDHLFCGLTIDDLAPAVATSGTVTSKLVIIRCAGVSASSVVTGAFATSNNV